MTAEPPDHRTAIRVRNAAIGLAGLLGAVELIRFIFIRSYNFDEISHAHMAWLVSIGEVPYRDFAANHFPFLWLLLTPAMWVLPHSPDTMMVLRGLALVLNAVFLGALGVLIGAELQARERIWVIVCLGAAVCCPLSLHFLIEFRPDAFANALIFSILAGLRLRASRNVLTGLISGFGLGVALLINTKYILFLLLLGPVALVMNAGQLRRIWAFSLAIGLGFSLALLGGLLLLIWRGVSLTDAWLMVVTYNGLVEKVRPFGLGLVQKLLEYWVWLAYSLAGLAGCAILYLRQRRLPGVLMVTMVIFLVMDLFVTTRPWKQYAASWLLLAAGLSARSWPPLIARLGPRTQAALALGGLAATAIGLPLVGIADGTAVRTTQDRAMVWLAQHVPPDGFVATSFRLHPVFRRDVFFKTVYDLTPGPVDGLEALMPRLAPLPYAEHFQPAGYEKDLADHPPAVIVLTTPYSLGQDQALKTYLAGHPDDYTRYQIPDTPIWVMQRRTNGTENHK